MAAPKRLWSPDAIQWVRDHANTRFDTDELCDYLKAQGHKNAFGAELTRDATGSFLSEWSHGRIDNAPRGLQYEGARQYVFFPDGVNKPAEEPRRKRAVTTSNELMELIGELPNGDVILRLEDGTLRQFREVTGG